MAEGPAMGRKAAVHSVIKAARTAVQAPAPTTPAKLAKAGRRPAVCGVDDKVGMGQHGQLRLHPWPGRGRWSATWPRPVRT